MKKTAFLAGCIVTILPSFALAQQGSLPTGGTHSEGNLVVSQSIGQVFQASESNTNHLVVEGLQQPYEISHLLGLLDQQFPNLQLKLYPNPAPEYLMLELNAIPIELRYEIVDAQGRLIQAGEIRESQTQISTVHLSPGLYFVNLFNKQNLKECFKIIKP